jgi:hypothetical protein
MSKDEKPINDEAEPKELSKDETTDLLELYKLEKPTREDIKAALKQHYAEFGRVGFKSEVDEDTVDNFYSHFTRNPKEYLEAELHFIQEIMESDLTSLVTQGYARAYNLVPEQEYQTPQAVFLMNGKRTDAKVMGNGQFGINLQNLFSKAYSRESKTYNMQRARCIIRNNSAHEATHVLVEQVEHSEDDKVNSLIGGAFNEGLATFAQEELDFAWSMDYLRDSENTLEIIRATFKGQPYEKILTDLCNMESLKKHKPQEIQTAQDLVSKGSVSNEEFRATLHQLLVDKNGPLYYAGYAVWKKIYETEGIEKVREVVKKGPKAFADFM